MTEAQILDAAQTMRIRQWTWIQIAKKLGVDRDWLREKLVGFDRRTIKSGTAIDFEKRAHVDAMRLKALIPADTRDFTARLMGDPLPGRSALDKRRAA